MESGLDTGSAFHSIGGDTEDGKDLFKSFSQASEALKRIRSV